MIVAGSPGTRYPWEPITIAEQLERTAQRHGDRTALIAGELRMTWRETRDAARRVARAMAAAGVRRGDNVGIWLPNQVEWVLGWFATAYLGAAVICVNTRYRSEEIAYILGRADVSLLLMRDRFLQLDNAATLAAMDRSQLPGLHTVVALGDAPPHTLPYGRFLAGAETVEEAEIDRRAAEVTYEQPSIVVFTSGTTGHPKGAVHSHTILRNECAITEWMDIGPESRILGHMPWFHVAGSMSGILPALISGGALVTMEQWNPTAALELIARERVSVFSGIPTHFIDLLDHPDLARYDTSSLASGWIGGASNPPRVIDGAVDVLGVRMLLPVYGMTETTSVTTFPRPDDPRDVVRSGAGVPVSDFEVMVSDPDGAELPAGVEGEIRVRGHVVMQGYYGDPEATARAIDAEGWFRTGDLGVLDEKGYLSITGRTTDMFIVGGSNAYPAEIEASLGRHPEIAQVYVVGVPDRRLGEVGFAFVQRRSGSTLDGDGVRAYGREHLADFKVPRHVEFVDGWPLTATGKIERFRLSGRAREHVEERPAAAP
jgi:fatty-acyl-CoA synthase